MNLSVGLTVPFDEAISWASKRVSVLPDEFYADIQEAARKGAFTVSGITGLSKLNHIKQSLDEAIRNGLSMRDWQKSLDADVMRLKPFHRETIFRNAVQSAYSAGRWEQQQRVKAIRPILMYDAINDSRTRPTHRALDAFMAPVDDPVWKRIYPPNGHNCRCTVVSLTEKQARARGWSGFVKALPAEPDEGWDHNPGLAYQESLDRSLADQIVAAPLQIVRAQQAKEMLQSARMQAKTYVLGKPDSDSREYGVAVNPQTGLVDAIFTGDGRSIQLPNTDANTRALNGSIFFHNHPTNSSLSLSDVATSAAYGMAEMHAVGKDGSWFRAITPKVSGAEIEKYRMDMASVSVRVEAELRRELLPLIDSGKLSRYDASTLHIHLRNVAVAAAGLFDYEVVVTGGDLGVAIDRASKVMNIEALKRRAIAAARQTQVRKYSVHNH